MASRSRGSLSSRELLMGVMVLGMGSSMVGREVELLLRGTGMEPGVRGEVTNLLGRLPEALGVSLMRE